MEDGTESEQISDDFTCAVCLDVLYKPIVLVCGHVSCFWCCQRSMHSSSESHCPLCRHPYHHFPAICHTLHFLLKKLYPISYNRRKIQTLEDEKHTSLGYSPDIDNLVTSDDLDNRNDVGQSSAQTYKQISVSDVLCAACKQLLFRPVALNCGHVYCEGCISIPTEGMLKCEACECRHPSGPPKLCRELDHFLEEQFSSEYALRRSLIQQKNQEQTQSTSSSNEANTQVSKLSFPTEETFLQWWTSNRSKIHGSVGCDMCGIFPIIGDRYQCQDCPEKSGYDLCGDCYNTGSSVPGRFNQKHTSSHRLELVKPTISRNVMHRLLGRRLGVISAFASGNQSSPNN
ncbi:putative transcription factor interactor and regulator LIM family [Helianthus annuus]|nr:putative transcription factor interactor and regulator LIM family [Helianthus annuus]KAJ0829907.1 putative transcription factor interactor and regulator LIM family [Helianthus annuus]